MNGLTSEKGCEQALGVLLQAAVTDLCEADEMLDYVERMFDPLSHAELRAALCTLPLVDHVPVPVGPVREAPGSVSMPVDHCVLPLVGLALQTRVSSPCRRWGKARQSAKLTAVEVTAYLIERL